MTNKVLFFDAVAPYEYNYDIIEKKGLGASESYLLSVCDNKSYESFTFITVEDINDFFSIGLRVPYTLIVFIAFIDFEK